MKHYLLLIAIASSFLVANSVKELSATNFYSVINSSKPTLVKFYANNCPACITMAPHYKKVAQEFGNKIRYAQINVNTFPNIARKYYIAATPTTVLFKNGKEIDRAIGGYGYNYLKKWAINILNYFKI